MISAAMQKKGGITLSEYVRNANPAASTEECDKIIARLTKISNGDPQVIGECVSHMNLRQMPFVIPENISKMTVPRASKFIFYRWSCRLPVLDFPSRLLFGVSRIFVFGEIENYMLEGALRAGKEQITLANGISVDLKQMRTSESHPIKRELLINDCVLKLPEYWCKLQTNIFKSFPLQKTDKFYQYLALKMKSIANSCILSIIQLQHISNYHKYWAKKQYLKSRGSNDHEMLLYYGSASFLTRTIILCDHRDEFIRSESRKGIDKGVVLADKPWIADSEAYVCKQLGIDAVNHLMEQGEDISLPQTGRWIKKQMLVCSAFIGNTAKGASIEDILSNNLDSVYDDVPAASNGQENGRKYLIQNPSALYSSFMIEYAIKIRS